MFPAITIRIRPCKCKHPVYKLHFSFVKTNKEHPIADAFCTQISRHKKTGSHYSRRSPFNKPPASS
ncbi:hypothetical protein BUE76_04450 [Cnuella takakiae]|nr:hypothetical protein BUE76_04450 [Cnuella takakiae]